MGLSTGHKKGLKTLLHEEGMTHLYNKDFLSQIIKLFIEKQLLLLWYSSQIL